MPCPPRWPTGPRKAAAEPCDAGRWPGPADERGNAVGRGTEAPEPDRAAGGRSGAGESGQGVGEHRGAEFDLPGAGTGLGEEISDIDAGLRCQ